MRCFQKQKLKDWIFEYESIFVYSNDILGDEIQLDWGKMQLGCIKHLKDEWRAEQWKIAAFLFRNIILSGYQKVFQIRIRKSSSQTSIAFPSDSRKTSFFLISQLFCICCISIDLSMHLIK